ncbi:beta-N-acetylhexosaminidase [Bacteroides sp.]
MFYTLSTNSQTENKNLTIPELIDFMLLKCDLQHTAKDKEMINTAFAQGINGVFIDNNKELADYATNVGLIPLSKYTLSKYPIPNGLKNKSRTTLVFARERSDGYIRNALIDQCFVEYSNDSIFGNEKWLKKLIDSSLDIRTRLISNNRLIMDVTNKSSIPYSIHIANCENLTPVQTDITLSPETKTTLFFDANKIENTQYAIQTEIKNALTDKGKTLNHTFNVSGMIYAVGSEPKERYAIIPAPLSLEKKQGEFVINSKTRIILRDKKAKKPLPFLTDRLSQISGLNLKIQNTIGKENNNIIIFTSTEDKTLKQEGYKINVTDKQIQIQANGEAGFFYAIQSLLQLLPPEIYSDKKEFKTKWSIPAVIITDIPRFDYRGLHLDVGRHMYPVTFIKKYIDLLAMQKMNRFHWHLTEDQGWRIEIKRYPKLTEIGSMRAETISNRYSNIFPEIYDSTPYGGFYTQEEIKEVVAYAQKRYVTIIPEIDLPGHMLAALATYPELGCTGGPYKVGTRWGIYDDVLCAGNEDIYPFIENIMDEIFQLFPSEFVHIGGDECPKTRWKVCPKCQAKIKSEKLKNEHELQSYVIKRVEKYINAHGKKVIGWDEILEGGIAPNAALMSWRGVAGGITAAKSGHPVIMTPNTHVYLDHYQANMDISPLANGRIAALEWTYSYDPIPQELTPEEAENIKGIQANVWTEYIRTPEQVEYMAYPRANAVAEIGWSSPDRRNWNDYLKRLQIQFERWSFYGLNYATHYKSNK